VVSTAYHGSMLVEQSLKQRFLDERIELERCVDI
jgi:hypothetical protein